MSRNNVTDTSPVRMAGYSVPAGITSSHVQTHSVHTLPVFTLSVLEVMSPQRSDFVLATNIPDCEADIFIFYSFHIET